MKQLVRVKCIEVLNLLPPWPLHGELGKRVKINGDIQGDVYSVANCLKQVLYAAQFAVFIRCFIPFVLHCWLPVSYATMLFVSKFDY